MNTSERCPECGAVIPEGGPAGWCGPCLLKLGLERSNSPAETAGSVEPEETPPEHPGVNELTTPAPPAPWRIARAGADPAAVIEQPGDRIGRYKLLQKLGEGGCGVVYMAEQEEPVRRRVALKVIKLGMDTRQVVARFGAERQALALMEHPNIAKVLDAGATDRGRPYFVMELVRGLRITAYCDQHKVSTGERLRLFTQVCQAIQHAHQKGVIHRDIKPSNILVTLHDGVPVPKVIDFGIAKATQGRLTDQTLFTAFEQFIGTPAYMSPEQAELSGLDIDTRSDIYSLGVLLYELLVGTTPFAAAELLASGLDQMRRTIREREPVRPSTRLNTMVAGELTTTAKHRRTDAPKLVHLVRGDLDWIVMKCLEKDRTRRYETANGLAKDIERHLYNEPVVARPASAAYRCQKAWRRNRLLVSAATAVAMALLVGIAASLWQATAARRAQVSEKREREKADNARREAEASEQKARKAQTNEVQQRQRAEAGEMSARQSLYAADMSLAYQSWQENNLGVALELLNKHRLAADQSDSRGWEWRYLWGLCQSEARYAIATNENFVRKIAMAPSGAFLATTGKEIKIWDVVSRRPIETIEADDAARAVAFSPDGKSLAFTTWEHGLKLWDVGQHRESGQFPDNPGSRWKSGLAFSPDGRTLAVAGDQGRILLWDIETRTATTLKGHEGEVRALLFLPDGQTLISGGEDFAIRFWSIANGRQITNLTSHTDWVQALAVSPDGKTLASGSWDHTVRVWDVPTRRSIAVLTHHTAQVSTVAFSPSGRFLTSGAADHLIKLWDTADWHEASTLRGQLQEVESLAFSPQGADLFSAGKDGVIMVWNTQPKSPETNVLRRPADSRWWGLGFFLQRGYPIRVWTFPDSGIPICRHANGTFNLWDPMTLEPLPVHSEPKFMDQAAGLALSRDGKRFAFATKAGSMVLWDVPGERQLDDFPWVPSESAIVAFSPDTKLVAAAAAGKGLTVWDLEKRREIATLPKSASLPVDGVLSFAANSKSLAVGNEDGTVEVWDLRRKERVGMWPAGGNVHGNPLIQAISPDGTMLALALNSDSTLRLREIVTRHEVVLARTLNGFMSIAFAPDGQRLVAGCTDGSIWIWNPLTGQQVARLQGHSGSGRADRWVMGLSFLADGNTLISSTSESVRVWHAPSWDDIEGAKRSR